MFKKTRQKFLLMSMLIMLFLFSVITITFYMASNNQENQESRRILHNILSPDVMTPGPNGNLREPRSFLVVLNNNQVVLEVSYDSFFFTEVTVSNFLNQILQSDADEGKIDYIKYLKLYRNNQIFVAATDRSNEQGIILNNVLNLVFVEAIAFFLLSILIWFLSAWIVKPLMIATKKQKEFISNASHELKTPLAVISANVDVIKMEYGKNQWTSYIQQEIDTMNRLITDLLTLSTIEEQSIVPQKEPVNVSEKLLRIILSFEAAAYENKRHMTYDIESEITIQAIPNHIDQLIRIFMDNALKHTDDTGKIHITLKKEKHITMTFYNSGSKITEAQKPYVFERFYRHDQKKNSYQKGFGLGLAMAKAICDQNKYELQCRAQYDDFTEFIIKF